MRAGLSRVESNVVRVALQSLHGCTLRTPHQAAARQHRGAAQRRAACLRVRRNRSTDRATPLLAREHPGRSQRARRGAEGDASAGEPGGRAAQPADERHLNQLLDRHFELAELEANTLTNYRSLAEKHIRPLIGSVKVGALDGDLFDSFYATLRRCRDHCGQRQRIDHRTDGPHHCDDRCKPHQCRPLSNGSVRYIHFILSGALKRAVRWRWIATNPIAQTVPPPQPKPNPQPPTAEQAARILKEAWQDPDWAILIWLTMVTGFRPRPAGSSSRSPNRP